MISARDFFLHSGMLYTQPNFWSAEECWQLREISKFSRSEDAGIYAHGKQESSSSFRKTKRILVTESIQQEMQRSILTIQPALEKYFDTTLYGLQRCQFLQYSNGDYFRIHQDEREPSSNLTRKISVVVFVNSRISGRSGTFSGGDLVFYKDMAGNLNGDGFSMKPEEGLLLAFPSYLLHEVDEITNGIRYSVVSWFF